MIQNNDDGIKDYVVPCFDFNNCKLYNCDNLQLLVSLPDACIDLIYCDVLYNTGRTFRNFVDVFESIQEAVLWYKCRLLEMKRTLKYTGSIYIHLDYRLSHYIKVLMDDIFGVQNFRNEIIWYYDNGGGRSKTTFNKKHDTLLWYSKSNTYIYNIDAIRIEYKKSSKYAKTGIKSKKGKVYMPNENGKNVDDVWIIPIINPMSNERVDYDTQKPKKLLERIILANSNENDTIADFFLGSGTSAVVSSKLNRKFIGCDISKAACDIAIERLQLKNE